MFVSLRAIGLALLMLPLALGFAAAQAAGVNAAEGWVKLPAAGDTATPAFVVVNNPTMYDIYLVSAESEIAGAVEFRDKSAGAAAQPVKEVTAPAYGRVEMTADGVHLWLKDLKRPLTAGEKIAIQLTTDAGLVLQTAAIVR